MFLQIVLVLALSQNVYPNTLPFYNPRHHEMVRKETSDVHVDVQLGVHVDIHERKESQV